MFSCVSGTRYLLHHDRSSAMSPTPSYLYCSVLPSELQGVGIRYCRNHHRNIHHLNMVKNCVQGVKCIRVSRPAPLKHFIPITNLVSLVTITMDGPFTNHPSTLVAVSPILYFSWRLKVFPWKIGGPQDAGNWRTSV